MADAQYMLHKLQVGCFDSKNEEKTPSQRADAIISSISQVCLARAANRIPSAPWRSLMDDLMRNYSSTVDCSTDQGVNNYAEGALAVSGHYAADSSHWKSALDEEQIKTTEKYQKLLEASQEEQIQMRAEISKTFPELRGGAEVQSARRTSAQDGGVSTENGATDRMNNNHLRSHEEQPASSYGHDGQQEQSSRIVQTPPGTRPDMNDGGGQKSNSLPGNFNWPNERGGHFPRDRQSLESIPSSGVGLFISSIPHEISHREGQRNNLLQGSSSGAHGRDSHHQQAGPFSTSGTRSESVGPGQAGRGLESFERNPTVCDTRCNFPSRVTGESIWQSHSMKRKNPSQHDIQSPDEAAADGQPGTTGPSSSFASFKTARQQLTMNNQQNNTRGRAPTTSAYGTGRKVLGVTRKGRGLNSKFVPPVMPDEGESDQRAIQQSSSRSGSADQQPEEVDERLQGIEPKMVDLIMKEIMDHGPPITWNDIAGLEYAKKTIKEIVVWPMLRPDIFHGLRGPPKGLLLFGPPGTGKTLIGKCIASQSKSTFFSISASSLTSKWVGEGEKMVRALFTIARCHQPAVIFIDEIDSLLSQRSTDEHESSRRIKTEFLIQLDGATSSDDDRILVVGATNRPQEIDEAARRRLVKRLYIPLPDLGARRQIILNLLSAQGNYSLSDDGVALICERTDGYSGADVANLCREAALGPIRSLDSGNIQNVSVEEVRPISYEDFLQAVEHVKPSVSAKDLEIYLQWNQTYGSGKT